MNAMPPKTHDQFALELEALSSRLGESRAILDAIELGELLSDTPAESAAQFRHQVGISLLEVLRRDLEQLGEEFGQLAVRGQRNLHV